jgi:SAM-dependent methyltransferase
MRVDIDRLQAFYASPLGRMAGRQVMRRLAAIWPHANGLDVLGFGYGDPLLEPYRAGARRTVSAAPDTQGVARWPADSKASSVLVEEERLPFKDSLFDRIIVSHGLEEAESPRKLLRELWRVAAPEARILVIVANRSGLWARAESTPFGHGQPYTKGQLMGLLEDSMFQPTASARVLYAPPIKWGVVTSAGEAWERTGRFAWGGFGGVLMVEAMKRLYIEPKGRPARGKRVVKPAMAQNLLQKKESSEDSAAASGNPVDRNRF